jgi:hypothetical protein
MQRNSESIRVQLATADVPTASNLVVVVNKSLDAAAKTAVLTVDDSALMWSCNPKALASFMRALTS